MVACGKGDVVAEHTVAIKNHFVVCHDVVDCLARRGHFADNVRGTQAEA